MKAVAPGEMIRAAVGDSAVLEPRGDVADRCILDRLRRRRVDEDVRLGVRKTFDAHVAGQVEQLRLVAECVRRRHGCGTVDLGEGGVVARRVWCGDDVVCRGPAGLPFVGPGSHRRARDVELTGSHDPQSVVGGERRVAAAHELGFDDARELEKVFDVAVGRTHPERAFDDEVAECGDLGVGAGVELPHLPGRDDGAGGQGLAVGEHAIGGGRRRRGLRHQHQVCRQRCRQQQHTQAPHPEARITNVSSLPVHQIPPRTPTGLAPSRPRHRTRGETARQRKP